MHLRGEDWQWWWKAFYASGSVALYVFLYSINYLIFDLQGLNGFASAILYLGYSLIMAIAIKMSIGTIGFLTSLLIPNVYLLSPMGRFKSPSARDQSNILLCKICVAALSCCTTSTGYRF
ncbi:hypothetical protein CsSME_00026732 [Camellia sinensis var. sinensis]